jgi:hypothetical protein
VSATRCAPCRSWWRWVSLRQSGGGIEALWGAEPPAVSGERRARRLNKTQPLTAPAGGVQPSQPLGVVAAPAPAAGVGSQAACQHRPTAPSAAWRAQQCGRTRPTGSPTPIGPTPNWANADWAKAPAVYGSVRRRDGGGAELGHTPLSAEHFQLNFSRILDGDHSRAAYNLAVRWSPHRKADCSAERGVSHAPGVQQPVQLIDRGAHGVYVPDVEEVVDRAGVVRRQLRALALERVAHGGQAGAAVEDHQSARLVLATPAPRPGGSAAQGSHLRGTAERSETPLRKAVGKPLRRAVGRGGDV